MAAGFVAVAAVAAILALAAWVLQPLWRGDEPLPPPDPRVVALLARRQAAVAALRDLETERTAGRLSEADYERTRADVLTTGASAMAALDRLNHEAAESAAALIERVEADVAARRASAGPSAEVGGGDGAAG